MRLGQLCYIYHVVTKRTHGSRSNYETATVVFARRIPTEG